MYTFVFLCLCTIAGSSRERDGAAAALRKLQQSDAAPDEVLSRGQNRKGVVIIVALGGES